jgi:hypothetical protein
MDSVPVTDALSYNFFADSTDDDPSVTDLKEDDALRWLVRNSFIRSEFFREFFPNGPVPEYRLNLIDPFTRPHLNPGDVDLLLIDPNNPATGIAFECKRVKIVSLPDGQLKINGAQKVVKAVGQVNGYRALGFHQVYFLIILLDDGRHHTAPNQMFHYATGRQIDEILSTPWLPDLHEDIGVVYIRINQLTGKSIDYCHSISYCIEKPAARCEQPFDTTAKIQLLLKDRPRAMF